MREILNQIARLLSRPTHIVEGYPIGNVSNRHNGGEWSYVRLDEEENNGPFERGVIRDNLFPGERP